MMMMLGTAFLWPIIEMTGASLMHGYHPMQVVFLRYAAHLAILLAVLLPWKGVRSLRTDRPVLQLLRGVFMFGMPTFYVLAQDFASPRWVWSMFWAMPALALVAAAIVLKERPRVAAWLAVALGVLGATAIRGGEGGSLIGTVLALAMGATVAGYIVLSRVLRDEPLTASLFYTALGAFIPTCLMVWRVWTPFTTAVIVPAAAIGVISVGLLSFMDLAFEAAPASMVVPVMTLIPAWEAIIAIPLRGALPYTGQLVGIALIAVGFGAWFFMHHIRATPSPHVTEEPEAA
jgi:drug/metabolite transporter (DMT)-like permease